MDELKFTGELKRGSKGPRVRRGQEWLALHGFHVTIDGQFGPATELAMKQFQAANSLETHGRLDAATHERLVAPLRAALAPIPSGNRSLGELTAAWARQQLASGPKEIGGQNMGPWVRLYMDGNEGEEWRWCAGFVSFCLRRAAASLKVPVPLKLSYSCDELAVSARAKNVFLEAPSKAERKRISPGALFLVRGAATGDWVHAGVVTEALPEAFRTIEGNSNDEGSSEGYEVCARTRAYGRYDFILV